MKKFLVGAVLMAGFTAYSQSTLGNNAMESQISRGLLDSRNQSVLTLQPEKANEIRHGNVTYDGMFVQFLKSDNKLQLINPAAPPEYGSGWDNLIEDPSAELGGSPDRGNSGHEGLKLFSIGLTTGNFNRKDRKERRDLGLDCDARVHIGPRRSVTASSSATASSFDSSKAR